MSTLFKKSPETNISTLKIGKGPKADQLRALKIEGEAFQFRYSQSMNACFDLAHKKV